MLETDAILNVFTAGKLDVILCRSRQDLGVTAASRIAAELRRILTEKGEATVLLASAPSQNETLDALLAEPGIAWNRVTAFHMDEYIGLAEDHPSSFRKFQKDRVLSRVKLRDFYFIRGESDDLEGEIARYSHLLRAFPPDLGLLGIGENGHIAFNDPPVCDFEDPVRMKVVRLDEACRRQQVNDGCFATIGDVPTHAFTLTVPQLVGIPKVFVMVPGHTKRQAVFDAINSTPSNACPATILRRHPNAALFIDKDSGELLDRVGV